MPPMLPNGQFIIQVPHQQRQPPVSHQPLLNGPVPAGVIPTVGVDPNPQNPSTSDSHQNYRLRKWLFLAGFYERKYSLVIDKSSKSN